MARRKNAVNFEDVAKQAHPIYVVDDFDGHV